MIKVVIVSPFSPSHGGNPHAVIQAIESFLHLAMSIMSVPLGKCIRRILGIYGQFIFLETDLEMMVRHSHISFYLLSRACLHPCLSVISLQPGFDYNVMNLPQRPC